MTKLRSAAITGLLLAGVLAACAAPEEEAPACDRACLIDLTERYVAGIEGNSVEGLPFSVFSIGGPVAGSTEATVPSVIC